MPFLLLSSSSFYFLTSTKKYYRDVFVVPNLFVFIGTGSFSVIDISRTLVKSYQAVDIKLDYNLKF